jgi:hypothetical protein
VLRRSSCCLFALLALACAWPFTGCGGDDEGGSGKPKTVASGHDVQGKSSKAGKQDSSSAGRREQGTGEETAGGAGPSFVAPSAVQTSPDQQSFRQDPQPPKKSPKPPKSQSGGKPGTGPTAGMTPHESATYETARALCANPDSLQYAPEEIRDDAEALAEFAERFAPPGKEQIVHDGCLVGLKSIGID